MQFLLLCFVVLTISITTSTQNVLEQADSCFSTVQIAVPYTLWVGTNVTAEFSIRLTVQQYTAFYDLMKSAEIQSPEEYSFQTTCSQYGHYVTSIGGIQEDSTANNHWLIYVLSQAPDISNQPRKSDLSLAGVDGLRVIDGKYYLFWFRNTDFLGTHTLRDDVKEFMALVPTNKVLEITMDYLANDPELQEIFAYIQSEEFPKIHKIVEYLKQYSKAVPLQAWSGPEGSRKLRFPDFMTTCLKFIIDQGFDVYAFILEIQDILCLPQFEPTNTTCMGVGIYGLLDDVVAVLPLDDLKALFYVKMETRKYFKTIVTTIRSPVFVKMVDTVRARLEYQKLLETLQEMGVDVVCIIEHLRVQLGLPPV